MFEETKPTTYDPRNRPWFSPALSIEGVFWTLPYPYFERKEVGITASIARKVDSGSGQIVVAFDFSQKGCTFFGQGHYLPANSVGHC